MSKSKIIVLSDIHIGTNAPTVWYQRDFHEPYLLKVLDYVIEYADSVHELILLGDVVDFWTYPPDEQPPSFKEIMEANPNIFAANGKFSEVLSALGGNVTYVRGNHDMNITQDDLNQIQNPQGYNIKLSPDDIYYPLGNENKRIACTHGHQYTMFNAPDPNTRLTPLPFGHFVTRAVAYQQKRALAPGQTVADLPDQGAPNGIDLNDLVNSIDSSLPETLLNYMAAVTHMPQNQTIVLPDGQTTTLAEAKVLYRGLWMQWTTRYGGGYDGELAASKAAIVDLNGLYLGWFAQKLALECGADLVVMGHTHIPKLGLKDGLIQYVNSGFECPSRPDIGKKSPTFTEIDINSFDAKVLQITNRNGLFQIEPYPADKDVVIAPWSLDYSCYVIVDNTSGNSELKRVNYDANQGYYVVPPPEKILPGEIGRFWLQDYPGPQNALEGTKGQVLYQVNGENISFSFACPVGFWNPNSCSGSNFYTKINDGNWGSLNQTQKLGHPFFVKFVL